MADRTETIILDVEVDEADAVESIDNLTKANKELRKERNALNLQSESGKKRAQEINALLDENTNKIKTNVSALEKQKINIGNYRSALDGVHPALGKVGAGLEQGTQGFKAMTMQALRFIATPIGALLAALVAVFTLLKSALASNNELMDKFENITNAVGVVLNVIVARVGKLGEALIALVSGDFDKAIDLTSQAFTGLAAEIENAVAQGQLYLDLSRELEDAQRALRIETAKQENEIKRLVVAAKNRNLTFDEQEELLRRALRLEEELVAKRAENAQKDLVITAKRIALDRQLSQSSEETFDQFVSRLVESERLNDEQIDDIVGKIEAVEQARGSSLAFQEKLENSLSAIQEKRAVALEKQNKALEEQAALREANARAAREEVRSSKDGVERQDRKDPLVDAFTDRATVITDINDRMQDEMAERNEQAALAQIHRARAAAELEVEIERQKGAAIASILGNTASLFEQDSVAFKVLASAQALINTYLAATAALASGSKINPVFGIISAGAAVVSGLASVAKINGVEFAEGGIVLRGRSHAQGGIPIVAEGNEIIMTKGVYNNPSLRAQASAINVAGGGRSFMADGGLPQTSITNPINQQLQLMDVIKNLGPFEVSAVEMTKVQKKVSVKQKISKR
jgi:hypothetical protein